MGLPRGTMGTIGLQWGPYRDAMGHKGDPIGPLWGRHGTQWGAYGDKRGPPRAAIGLLWGCRGCRLQCRDAMGRKGDPTGPLWGRHGAQWGHAPSAAGGPPSSCDAAPCCPSFCAAVAASLWLRGQNPAGFLEGGGGGGERRGGGTRKGRGEGGGEKKKRGSGNHKIPPPPPLSLCSPPPGTRRSIRSMRFCSSVAASTCCNCAGSRVSSWAGICRGGGKRGVIRGVNKGG